MKSHLSKAEAFQSTSVRWTPSVLTSSGCPLGEPSASSVKLYVLIECRQVEMDDNLRIWRNFQLGNLVDLIMLDTRHYDRSITDLYDNTGYIYDIKNDAGRTLMGSRQESWLQRNLIESDAHWRIVGSQIGIFPFILSPTCYLLTSSLQSSRT